MIQSISSVLIGVLAFIGGLFPSQPLPNLPATPNYESLSSLQYDWEHPPLTFGSITFPTSLDSFENPGATQNVSTTVSHSSQHSNENDAIEALEAKMGIGASTAISNSVLNGTSAGVSSWTATPTITGLTATNILANGSTTLQAFTATRSTTTSATTTSFFTTTASSTNTYGSGLSSCTGTNFVQWSVGLFGCASAGTSGPTTFSTTSVQNLATTTLLTSDGSLPSTNTWEITLTAATTTGAGPILLRFNSDASSVYSYTYRDSVSSADGTVEGGTSISLLESDRVQKFIDVKVVNDTGRTKFVTFSNFQISTTTNSVGTRRDGQGAWANTAAITRIDIGFQNGGFFATGTTIHVLGY